MLALPLRFVFLALFRFAVDDVEQLPLLRLDVLLAGRPLLRRVVPQGDVRTFVVGRDDVRELHQRAVSEIDGEDVVGSDERDSRFVESELRRRLDVVGLRQRATLAGRGVPEKHIAVVEVDGAMLVARPLRVRRRRVLLLLVAELAQAAAVAIHDVRVAILFQRVGVELPGKVDALSVRRPPHLLGRPAVEARAAHDVVDGEIELLGCRGEGDDGKKDGNCELLHAAPPRFCRIARSRATACSMSA